MGKRTQKEAMQLGLTNLPKYTFYAQPRKIKVKLSKIKPDSAYLLENWMKSVDPSAKMDENAKYGYKSEYYYMAPEKNIYVEIAMNLAKGFVYNEDSHVYKIDIYTNNEEHVRAIAKDINAIWDDGILNHLDFKKLKKKYKVEKEDVINQWNAFL